MAVDLQNSVVLITGTDPGNSRFGTGFIIYQDDEMAYLLTCAHVVDDVGGANAIDVEGAPAAVVAYGSAAELDLAVLRVPSRMDKKPLPLQPTGDKDSRFLTAGFQKFGSHFLVRPLQGILGQTVALAVRGQADRVRAWDLKIEDDYQLQPGYSGSPVLDQAGGTVLGVVSHRQGQGERGLAISVEALPKLWPEMPETLLSSEPAAVSPPPIPLPKPGPMASQTNPSQKGSTMSRSISLFFSYAHEDEALRDELAKHLSIMRRQGVISDWYDRDITAGSEWADAIDDNLNTADIILLLVSPDFIASDYCYDVEMTRALERHTAKEAIVIPVILRPTRWQNAPFSKLQALPKNAKPVTTWPDQDEAFLYIAEAIYKVAEMQAKKPAPSPSSAPTSTPTPVTPSPAPVAATVNYNIPTIRRLLTAVFDDETLDIFCFDYYRDVRDSFSQGMSRTAKIQRLIEYCERNLAFETLLQRVEQENPAQYERFKPQLTA
ncbi:MAG: TIR domain-containing protein [Anaerolineales bacterium]|nr:TIR domain-containing protein [Anaerolineales bacterium]